MVIISRLGWGGVGSEHFGCVILKFTWSSLSLAVNCSHFSIVPPFTLCWRRLMPPSVLCFPFSPENHIITNHPNPPTSSPPQTSIRSVDNDWFINRKHISYGHGKHRRIMSRTSLPKIFTMNQGCSLSARKSGSPIMIYVSGLSIRANKEFH